MNNTETMLEIMLNRPVNPDNLPEDAIQFKPYDDDKLTNDELYGLLHSGFFRTCDTLHEAYELMEDEINKVKDKGDQIYLRMEIGRAHV